MSKERRRQVYDGGVGSQQQRRARPVRARPDDLDRWNHDIHYHPMVLEGASDGCARALDAGLR